MLLLFAGAEADAVVAKNARSAATTSCRGRIVTAPAMVRSTDGKELETHYSLLPGRRLELETICDVGLGFRPIES